jgi:hypothetical protein
VRTAPKADIAAIFSGNMYLYAGNGAGQLSRSGRMWPSGGAWYGFRAITAGDFNPDGRVDVAGIDANNDMRLYLGSGAGGNYLAGSQTNYDGLAKRQGFDVASVELNLAHATWPAHIRLSAHPGSVAGAPW